jgi:hypothetical protein
MCYDKTSAGGSSESMTLNFVGLLVLCHKKKFLSRLNGSKDSTSLIRQHNVIYRRHQCIIWTKGRFLRFILTKDGLEFAVGTHRVGYYYSESKFKMQTSGQNATRTPLGKHIKLTLAASENNTDKASKNYRTYRKMGD